MKKLLFLITFLAAFAVAAQSQAQGQIQVQIDPNACGRLRALVINAEPGDAIRFQLGHDLVQIKEVSEQDTPVQFDSGPFPASDWGFSVRVNDKVIFDEIVTVKPCTRTLQVQSFNCDHVTVFGTGWEQTEATVEIAIPPAEGGESRDDLLAIEQVQPNAEKVITTTLDWKPTPGTYTAVVLIDNIQQDPQSAGFEIRNCTAQLPFTGGTEDGFLMLLAGLFLAVGVVLIVFLKDSRHGQ
jgi:hypothetical protein